MVHIKLTYV